MHIWQLNSSVLLFFPKLSKNIQKSGYYSLFQVMLQFNLKVFSVSPSFVFLVVLFTSNLSLFVCHDYFWVMLEYVQINKEVFSQYLSVTVINLTKKYNLLLIFCLNRTMVYVFWFFIASYEMIEEKRFEIYICIWSFHPLFIILNIA